MTILATTFVAQPHFQFPEWMTALLLIASVTAMLFVFFKDVEARSAKRLVLCCAVGVALMFVYASIAHAASYIECKGITDDGTWTQWFFYIFWSC